MKIKNIVLFVSLFISFCLAHAKVLNTQETQLCTNVSKLKFPPADLPTAADRKKLKRCNARNLYYGINTPINYAAARQCAFLNLSSSNTEENDFELFGPNNILVMIYANGKGVKRDVDLATKVACSGYHEDSIFGLDIQYLQKTKELSLDHYTYDLYEDFCHHKHASLIWENPPTNSSPSSSFSSSYDDESSYEYKVWEFKTERAGLFSTCHAFEADFQNSKIHQITKNYSQAQKKALTNLFKSFSDFADQQVSTEIHGTDGSGTSTYIANMEFYATEEIISLKTKFVNALVQFETGNFPIGTEQDYEKAVDHLNRLNANAKLAYSKYQESDPSLPFGWSSEVEVQKAWAQWSKQFLKFAHLRYPSVPNHVWNLWLTHQRIEQVKALIDSLENPG